VDTLAIRKKNGQIHQLDGILTTLNEKKDKVRRRLDILQKVGFFAKKSRFFTRI